MLLTKTVLHVPTTLQKTLQQDDMAISKSPPIKKIKKEKNLFQPYHFLSSFPIYQLPITPYDSITLTIRSGGNFFGNYFYSHESYTHVRGCQDLCQAFLVNSALFWPPNHKPTQFGRRKQLRLYRPSRQRECEPKVSSLLPQIYFTLNPLNGRGWKHFLEPRS